MDQKRFMAFIVLSMAILIGWQQFIVPRIIGKQKPKADQAQAVKDGEKQPPDDGQPDDGKHDAEKKDVAIGPAPGDQAEKPEAEAEPAAEPRPRKRDVPQFPEKTVLLGSDDFKSGFRELVALTTHGAAVSEIQLNDPRYLTLEKRHHEPLKIIGKELAGPATLEMSVPQVGEDLNHLNWALVEVLPAEGPHTTAVFKLTLDDLEITKRYELSKVDVKVPNPEAQAYALKLDLTFRNLGNKERTFEYVLQGPTGLPLENVENTQKYRDIVAGFVKAGGSIDNQTMPAKSIADGKGEEWKNPMRYIGVDVQFFAALLVLPDDQVQTPYTKSAKQQLIGQNQKERSDITVEIRSVDLTLAKAKAADDADQVTHTYHLFAGPKRDDVLPAGAEQVIDFGSFFGLFKVSWISRRLLDVLNFIHRLTGSWGLAVICLTIVVRSAMFPISIKQARSAAKMQAIQPELAALKEKYGNDKEKMARAQMELFRKHNHNPFTGCLPLFLQLPIFMGLYSALNHAVDLRLAGFLWIDNLAAPDALFRMPFNIPFLGNDFNLLPIITIALFVAQQKMFMPPPANDEQAMQQKIMNYMMIFMGVMFYKVPAGLCVYFIASSLWGMGERKLLPKAKPGTPPTAVAVGPSGGGRPPRGGSAFGDKPKPETGGGLWAMLLKAAEKDTAARRAGDNRK
ncbi:MAG: YidC/Oxa1 family insertase periplasmic-domain containing protein [Planctomycetia bacterium]|nr:YidC/Oxa1 family insertase periplasmic-domain containing protein [Planctomycetia bacterium]